MLKVQSLSVTAGGKTIIQDITFQVRAGDWLMLVGPNGAGKSTLLNALAQGMPYKGQALFEGEPLKGMRAGRRARQLGLLGQRSQPGSAFTALEVIRLGRYAHSSFLNGLSPQDEEAVLTAAGQMGVEGYLHQSLLTLSGGELQRVFLAQLLAQDPKLLLLDEPANHLDLLYQRQLFELIDRWRAQGDRAVISVAHDLSLARRWGSRGLLLHQGRMVASGDIHQVLATDNLRAAYHMDVPAYMREMLLAWQNGPVT